MVEHKSERQGPIGWLTANRRYRRAIAWFLLASAAYVISFGPACWYVTRTGNGCRFVSVAYNPILRIWLDGRPSPAAKAVQSYANLALKKNAGFEANSSLTLAGQYELHLTDRSDYVVVAPGYRREDWRTVLHAGDDEVEQRK